MNRPTLIFLLVHLPFLGLAQAQDKEELPSPPPPVNVLQGGWDNNVANSQASQWKDANTNAPPNALMQLNWLRSEQNAMISNNNGVLNRSDRAQLDRIADDIKTTAPGSFEQHLAELPRHPRRLLAFLGSTIGNLDPTTRAAFLLDVRSALGPGDAFLLGTDLVKDPGRLVAAYDDAEGVTAAFNKNVLTVLNRELEADFDLDAFEHRAVWDAEHEWVEMRLESRREQRVRLAQLDLQVAQAAGEQLRTEISAKFRREGVVDELAAAGLTMTHWWTDPDGDFALSLSVPA